MVNFIQPAISSPPLTLPLQNADTDNVLSEKKLVKKFNKYTTLQTTIRKEVIRRIDVLKQEVFTSKKSVNDSGIGTIRLALLKLYKCRDPHIKESALRTLIEILEGDPLTQHSTYLLVSLQKKLIKKIQIEREGQENKSKTDDIQDLYPELQYFLVKAYALTLECILLQMYCPDPNIGRLQQTTKEDIMLGVEKLEDLFEGQETVNDDKNEIAKENEREKNFLEGSFPEINFWLHYSKQAALRIKTEESDLKIALERVWNIVKAGFNIARAIKNPDDGDVELENAYNNLKNAFAFIGFKKDWFEDVLFIRKMSRYSLIKPELFSQLVYFIQTKKIDATGHRKLIDKIPLIGDSDPQYEKKLLFGIVLDLEALIMSTDNDQIQISSLKLLLQHITKGEILLRERIQKALSKMTTSPNTRLKNTAILLLRFLYAVGLVEKNNIPSSAFDKYTLQGLLNQESDKKALSDTKKKHAYYRHVIHFFLKRVAEIKGGGDYASESLTTLMAGSKEKEVVEAILTCIADISPKLLEPNTLGRNLYHMCVERENIDLIDFLRQRLPTIDINAKEYLKGETPLHLAVKRSSLGMVRTLTNNGAKIYVKNEDGETPLHQAVRTEYCLTSPNIVSNLIRKEADTIAKKKRKNFSLALAKPLVNAKSNRGKTSLNYAIESGNKLVINVLLHSFAKVKEERFGSYPLIVACIHAMDGERHNEKILEDMIEYLIMGDKVFNDLAGIYLMEVLTKNGTELRCSPEFARFHCEKFVGFKNYRNAFKLFKNRIHVINVEGEYKIKATGSDLIEAIKSPRGNTSASQSNFSLLRQGQFNMNGLMMQILGASSRRDLKMTQTSIKSQMINEKNDLGICALHIAAVCGKKSFMTFLLDSGADINAMDVTGMTALHFAALYHQNKIIELLLTQGADPNIANQYGDTPFMIYCGHIPERNINTHFSVLTPEEVGKPDKKKLQIVQLFIKKKAKISLYDKEKYNCLHHAVIGKNGDIISCLVQENKELFWEKSRYSPLPIDLAYQNKQKDEISALLGHFSAQELVGVAKKYDKQKKKSGPPFVHLLADVGESNALRKLFKEDPSFERQTDGTARQETPLHRAAIHGHLSVVKVYYELKFDLYVRDGFGNTIALLAAFFSQKVILKQLIKWNYDFSKENDSGRLPIHHAAMTGEIELLKLCKDMEFKLSQDGSGDLPIHITSRHGHKDAVEHLLEICPDTLHLGNDEGNAPAHLAASKGHKDIVSLLLEKGYDPDTSNIFSETIMHLAALDEGEQEVLKFLIEKKVDLRATDFEGRTPLHNAAFIKSKKGVGMILEKGANISGPPLSTMNDIKNEIPLLEVLKREAVTPVEEGMRKMIIEMMLEDGASLHHKNGEEQNFLHLACKGGNLSILQFLVELKEKKKFPFKMDFNKCDSDGNGCMHYAVEGGHENVVRYLLTKDCAKNKANDVGTTPLLLAAKLGMFSICEILSKKNEYLSSKDDQKMNILHHIFSLPYPLSKEGKNFLKKVIKANSELLLGRDKFERTPLHMLVHFGHVDCMDLVIHNLPKKMSTKKMNQYLWDASPGKTPKQIVEEQKRKHQKNPDEQARFIELLNKINNYPLEDLGKNTHKKTYEKGVRL